MRATREISAILIGAASGLLIGGAIALASAWLSGDAHAGSLAFVSLVAVALGAPVGAASAFLADRVLLTPVPTARLSKQLPLLFTCALAGALPGLVAPLVALWTAPLALIACAAWLRARWERSGSSTLAPLPHP